MAQADPGANEYYRLTVPMKAALKTGAARVFVQSMKDVGSPKDLKLYRMRAAVADVHLFYGAPGPSLNARVKELRALKPGIFGPYRRKKARPSIIWTLDDDYHNLSPFNQAFLWNGYKVGDQLLGRGDDVKMPLEDGSVVTVWKYGHQYPQGKFLPEKNRQRILKMDETLRMADGVTFTSQRLMDFYQQKALVKGGYVYPNSILFDDYELLPDPKYLRDDPKEVRVLWQGGSSHYGDLLSIREPLAEIMHANPHIKLILWGGQYPTFYKHMPKNQVELLGWSPYSAYRRTLATLDFDFALAPLVDNQFNQSKSCIKFYEPAALRTPRPTLTANVPPYSDEMLDGVIGLEYEVGNPESFKEKFMTMVEDAGLRKQLGKNCQEWLREYRNAETTTPPYIEWCYDIAKGLGTGGVSQPVAELLATARRTL
jgi:glycosyltransferase involved in cell wall biosynthesis